LGIIKKHRPFDAVENCFCDIIEIDGRIVAVEIDQYLHLKLAMTRPDLHFGPQQSVELLLVNLRLRGDLKNEEVRQWANLPALGGAAATPWLWGLGLWQGGLYDQE